MLAHTELNHYIRPLTVIEYEKMVSFGIIDEYEPIELIAGRLTTMTPIGISHASIVDYLSYLFYQVTGNQAIVRIQSSIYLDKTYMPEPDIAIIHYREDFYRTRRAKAEDVLLIVEVADSSFKYDSEIKIPAYAKFNIPEVWLIDINNQSLIRYFNPADGSYQTIETHDKLNTLSLIALPNVTLNLAALF